MNDNKNKRDRKEKITKQMITKINEITKIDEWNRNMHSLQVSTLFFFNQFIINELSNGMQVSAQKIVSFWEILQLSAIIFLGSYISPNFLWPAAHYTCRHANHIEIYTDRCKKLGIITNECVYARTQSLESIRYNFLLIYLTIY